MTKPDVWSKTVELNGRRVTVFEMATRQGVLYLRWRPMPTSNWKHESLKRTLRTSDGRIIEERRRWAITRANDKLAALVAAKEHTDATRATAETPRDVIAAPLTLAEGKALVMSGRTGKYHSDTPHRREVVRSIDFAIALWGADQLWNALRRAHLRELGRAKLDALIADNAARVAAGGEKVSGHRAAEVVVRDVIAVANWLRAEEQIAEDAAVAPKEWKKELMGYWMAQHHAPSEPTPFRPRHTLAELRAVLAAAPRVDPRLHLLLALGAEQRGGQVVRTMRSMIVIADDGSAAEVRLPSSGKKRGAIIECTRGQLAVLRDALTTGYLRVLEAAYRAHEISDYPLFPAGQMPGSRTHMFRVQRNGAPRSPHGPATPTAVVARHAHAQPTTMTTVRDWFHEAEDLGGVQRVKGRAAYGLRRVAVDAATELGISAEGLQEHGGWTDSQTPNTIYRDQERRTARKEARAVRAKIRGETVTEPPVGSPAEEGTE